MFSDHVALLERFLTHRRDIVDRIERTLLNVRGKDMSRSRDRRQFDRLLHACFVDAPGEPRESAALTGQLAAAHLAAGFEPVRLDRHTMEFDPLELIPRAYVFWDATRWPGGSGRLAYAHTIFSAFIVRQLELLSLRIWDAGTEGAADRLDDVQQLLDHLNSPKDTVVFVDDARWLVQTAQGPLTRHLRPYFDIADRIGASFHPVRRLELHAAGAKLAGGHLRSQIRYRVWNSGRPIDDPELMAFTRLSNSMDTALLVRDLVPLLDAYGEGEDPVLADAILQGLSADPELLLTRLDLLPACTIVEDLDMGDHLATLKRYGELIGGAARALSEDAPQVDPARRSYSPFGISYGFCADLFNNVAASTLTGHRPLLGGLEQMFVGLGHAHGDVEEKLACADAWRRLPTRAGEREHFDHSPEWAGQIFGTLMRALESRAARPRDPNASDTPAAGIAIVTESPNAQEYCFTSDVTLATATGATPHPAATMISDRSEGRFLASAETDGHWFGVSKLIVTLFIAQGKEARITAVPPAVASRLSGGTRGTR